MTAETSAAGTPSPADSIPAAVNPTAGETFKGAVGTSSGIEVKIRSLMDAGAHFGHQTDRWNPKMLPFIYGERNRVHIINLDATMQLWTRARKYVVDQASRGAEILFVGTKQQAREVVQTEARRCNAHFITSRWLGGTLSNFQTIKNSIERMRKLTDLIEQSQKEDSKVKLNKKERLVLQREVDKLQVDLGGIANMRRTPDLMFVIDINKEWISVAEARRLHIPVVALVDTNVDPSRVQFPIPSNDDATRTIKLFASAIADAIIEGRQIYEATVGRERREGRGDRGSRGQAANDAQRGQAATEAVLAEKNA